MTSDKVEPIFNPSLWRQRRTFLLKILSEHCVKSVLDYGCGEGALLSVLTSPIGCVDEIVNLAGLDISSEVLIQCAEACEPMKMDYDELREKALDIYLYQGSVDVADSRLAAYEAIVCSEVIEHLEPKLVDGMLATVLGIYRPRLFIVTTPNAEYNINFPELCYGTDRSKFRHDDHRFEWTRCEFQAWCQRAATEYGYRVEYHGIGRMKNPLVAKDVGHCTQACVFHRLDDPARAAKSDLDVKQWRHELFQHIAFPWYNKSDKEEHEIIQELNDIITKLTTITYTLPNFSSHVQSQWCETWSWDELPEDSPLPPPATEQVTITDVIKDISLEELWSVLRVRQLCRNRERLRELLDKRENIEMR